MRYFFGLVVILFSFRICPAQLPFREQDFFARLSKGSVLPEDLLKTRTVVFYPYSIPQKELETVQASFQRTGIDAVVYLENDLLTGGRDIAVATAQYLSAREITNLAFLQKNDNGYSLLITPYNRKASFVETSQAGWYAENPYLSELLLQLYRDASNGLKRENFLINDFPETNPAINPIGGRRGEYYALDLKVDMLAVPRFGDEAMDKELEEILKMYPFKYTITEASLSESELRKRGNLFVLRFVHTRDKMAKQLMGYDMTKSESALVSITYPGDSPRLKTIGANEPVFKFYFKHIESGNVYLGTKWDADTTWQQALINQLKGMKIELKVN